MKHYIGLLALCFLPSMAMEPAKQASEEEQANQIVLIAADGGEVAVSREIAENIPVVE